MKKANLTKKSNLTKMSNLTKNLIWEKSQFWERCQFSLYPPPPPPPIVYIWYHNFSVPKRNFEKTKRKQNLLWNSNSCDLDAELETWAASRWKLLMQYSRWFTVNDKFSQSRLKCTIARLSALQIKSWVAQSSLFVRRRRRRYVPHR